MESKGLDGLERCPRCFQIPTVSVGKQIELACLQHGHMAIGDSLSSAIRHWNLYIKFVTPYEKAA